MIVNLLPMLMEQHELSIRELSRRTGVTYTTIRAVYHGQRRSVNLDVLDAICLSLNVQPGDIFMYLPPGQAFDEELTRESLPESNIKRSKPGHEKIPGGSDGWITWE
jgi:putative transcriptional regulator